MKRIILILILFIFSNSIESFGNENYSYWLKHQIDVLKKDKSIDNEKSDFNPFEKNKSKKHPSPYKKKKRLKGTEPLSYFLFEVHEHRIHKQNQISTICFFITQSDYSFNFFFSNEKRGPPTSSLI